MALSLNAVELGFDRAARLTLYNTPYLRRELLFGLRRVAPRAFITRLGNDIWGYSLPAGMVERHGFQQASVMAEELTSELFKRLIGWSVGNRVGELGYEKTGHDRYCEVEVEVFTLGLAREVIANCEWTIRPFFSQIQGLTQYWLILLPRIGYSLTKSLAELMNQGIDWQLFGRKFRSTTGKVVEGKRIADDYLVFEDETEQECRIRLTECRVIPSTANRRRYIWQAVPNGARVYREMKQIEKDFHSLPNVFRRVEELKDQIGHLEIGTELRVELGDLVRLVEREAPDLQ